MDNRKKGLVKNTFILLIGDFSSKLLAFVLVPLYSNYLAPSDYGQVDLYITALSMLYTVVSLQTIESSFRFIQDCKNDNEYKSVITNTITTATFGIIVFTFVLAIYCFITGFTYFVIFVLYISTTIFSNLFMHTIRGMNRTLGYVKISVLSTLLAIILNIVFIAGIRFGAFSLLITPILVNSFIILIIVYREKLINYFNFDFIDLGVIKNQLRFSLPLVPYSLSVWLLASIGRFILLYYYDTSSVGILAFSLKYPILLSTISGVFYMAWQVSAVSQENATDKNSYASSVFNQYASLQFAVMIVVLPIIKILIFTITGVAYRVAWVYIPLFLVGVMFKSFAQFYNAGFYSSKKTGMIFANSIFASIVYIVIGLVLAKPLYILGVAISYALAEFIRWIFIVFTVKKYLTIKINYRKLLPQLLIVILFNLAYYVGNVSQQFFFVIIGGIIGFILNRKEILATLLIILRKK